MRMMWLYVFAVPAFAYEAWLHYLVLSQTVPIKAGIAGSMGVVAGMLPYTGLALARIFWNTRREHPMGIVAATSVVLLVGLLDIMERLGEFGPAVYGELVPYFTIGGVLGVPAGLAMMLGLKVRED